MLRVATIGVDRPGAGARIGSGWRGCGGQAIGGKGTGLVTSERQTTTRRNVESATLLAQGKVNEVYSQGLVPEVQSGNGHTAATLPQHQAEHRDAGGVPDRVNVYSWKGGLLCDDSKIR